MTQGFQGVDIDSKRLCADVLPPPRMTGEGVVQTFEAVNIKTA